MIFYLTVIIFLVPVPSRAAPEVGGESRIVAATVFPDRAEVLRVVEASLPAGPSTLVIENLPANLIAASVRVRGRAHVLGVFSALQARDQYLSTSGRQASILMDVHSILLRQASVLPNISLSGLDRMNNLLGHHS